MKTLPRTQFGNPILRAKAKAIPAAFVKTGEFKSLVRQMFQAMRAAQGVGLAAPQVGHPVRLAVIGIAGRPQFRRVIANPKIAWHSGTKALDWEGCLSFPDGRGQVPRWSAIKVQYLNEKGQKVTENLKGYAARVFQHEIDHLNGIVYVDRMPNMKTLMTHKEFLKRISK